MICGEPTRLLIADNFFDASAIGANILTTIEARALCQFARLVVRVLTNPARRELKQ